MILNLVSNMIQPLLRYSIQAPGADLVTLIKDLPLGQAISAQIVRRGSDFFLFVGNARILKLPLPERIVVPEQGQRAELVILAKTPIPKFSIRLLSEAPTQHNRLPENQNALKPQAATVRQELQIHMKTWFPDQEIPKAVLASLPQSVKALAPLLPDASTTTLMRSIPRLLDQLISRNVLPPPLGTMLKHWLGLEGATRQATTVPTSEAWQRLVSENLAMFTNSRPRMDRPLIPMPESFQAVAPQSLRMQWAVQAVIWWLEQQGSTLANPTARSTSQSLWDTVLYHLLNMDKKEGPANFRGSPQALLAGRELLRQVSAWLLQSDIRHASNNFQKNDVGIQWYAEWPPVDEHPAVQIRVEERASRKRQQDRTKTQWSVELNFQFSGDETLSVLANFDQQSGHVAFRGDARCLSKLDKEECSRFAAHMTNTLGLHMTASVRRNPPQEKNRLPHVQGHWEV